MGESELTRGRILVVDDEPGIRELLQFELGFSGYDVQSAPNGFAGLDLARAERFDLVLLDITMPGIDGVETLRRLKNVDRELEVVICTGYGTVETAVECMRLGAYDFITKPYEMESMLALVARAIDARRLRTSNALFRSTQEILRCTDPAQVGRAALELAGRALGAVAGALVLGGEGAAEEALWPGSEDRLAQAAAERGWRRLQDMALEESVAESERRWLYAPVAHGGRRGLLVVGRPTRLGSYSQADFDHVAILASQALLAIENASLVERLQRKLQELTRARDLLIQSEKMAAIGQLSAGMVHDMAAPVQLVIAGVEDLDLCLGADAGEARECLEQVRMGADRLHEMFRSLTRFARLESIDAPMHRLSLGAVCRKAARLAGGSTPAGCRVEVRVPDAGDEIFGHVGQLQQVVVNLIVNAGQAIQGSGGCIEVRVVPAGESVAVEVEDNGCGMPPDVVARIFDAFFTTKPPGVGTGLGLAVSMEIVRRHGGDIEVQSAPGRGTCMRVRLPRAAAPERVETPVPALEVA
jgi:signal transduction histidine kinase